MCETFVTKELKYELIDSHGYYFNKRKMHPGVKLSFDDEGKMIRLRGVTQHYGVRPVLRNIDLDIESGQAVSVVGPNGMGKTTLLAVLAGTLTPQRGFVEVDGLRRKGTAEEELAIRRKVVYLPDHPWLPGERTGREFLLAVAELYDIESERRIDHVQRLLDLFNLSREGDWPIRSYSQGQKKKIALSSALVTEAPILLLDEPFSGGLDPAGILALKHVFKHLTQHPAHTIVMSTPVPELVEEVSQRILILREGQIAAFDTIVGLRRSTGVDGSLADVLGRIIHPQTEENVRRYFEGRES
jgi:ABC-2 type transport system ATP-binding protein